MTLSSLTARNLSITALAVVLTVIAVVIAVPVVRLVYRIDSFITTDRLKNLENSVDTSTVTAQMTANAYGEIAKSTTNAIDNHVSPAIDRIASRVDSAMRKVEMRVDALAPLQSELTATVAQGRATLINTDEQVNGSLLPELTATVHSINLLTQNQLTDAVAQFALAGKNLVVITSDPALMNLPSEIDKIAKSLNISAGNVEVVTSHLAGISGNMNAISKDSADKVHSLLYPKPAPFFKRYILYPLRDIGGLVYLFVKIANGL